MQGPPQDLVEGFIDIAEFGRIGTCTRSFGPHRSQFSIFSPPLLEEFACPLVTSKLTWCRDSGAGFDTDLHLGQSYIADQVFSLLGF